MIDANTHVLPLRPDRYPQFRMAQLLLVLAESHAMGRMLDLERLAIVEFLAANPFLVFGGEDVAAEKLQMNGFGRGALSYASPGQRFATRRTRVQSDTAQLIAYGLARISAHDGRRVVTATELGNRTSEKLTSVYADAFRMSTRLVLPLISRSTDAALYKRLQEWLRAGPVLFDLLDVGDAVEFVDASNEFWMEI